MLDRFNKIGIELEGAWRYRLAGFKHDGSVTGFYLPNQPWVGEIASPPLVQSSVAKWIKEYKPDSVNTSCGLHVHVSFKNLFDYIRLMDNGFYKFFLEELEIWGNDMNFPPSDPFWSRLKGYNKFCERTWNPWGQVVGRGRYTHLNFCYLEHGTVECRLFPGSNDPKRIKACVDILLKTYDKWLSKGIITKSTSPVVFIEKKE